MPPEGQAASSADRLTRRRSRASWSRAVSIREPRSPDGLRAGFRPSGQPDRRAQLLAAPVESRFASTPVAARLHFAPAPAPHPPVPHPHRDSERPIHPSLLTRNCEITRAAASQWLHRPAGRCRVLTSREIGAGQGVRRAAAGPKTSRKRNGSEPRALPMRTGHWPKVRRPVRSSHEGPGPCRRSARPSVVPLRGRPDSLPPRVLRCTERDGVRAGRHRPSRYGCFDRTRRPPLQFRVHVDRSADVPCDSRPPYPASPPVVDHQA